MSLQIHKSNIRIFRRCHTNVSFHRIPAICVRIWCCEFLPKMAWFRTFCRLLDYFVEVPIYIIEQDESCAKKKPNETNNREAEMAKRKCYLRLAWSFRFASVSEINTGELHYSIELLGKSTAAATAGRKRRSKNERISRRSMGIGRTMYQRIASGHGFHRRSLCICVCEFRSVCSAFGSSRARARSRRHMRVCVFSGQPISISMVCAPNKTILNTTNDR